jgi:hypothetical protein
MPFTVSPEYLGTDPNAYNGALDPGAPGGEGGGYGGGMPGGSEGGLDPGGMAVITSAGDGTGTTNKRGNLATPDEIAAAIGMQPGSYIGSGNGPNDGYYNTPSGQPTGNRPLGVEDKLWQEQHPSGSFTNPLGAQTQTYNANNPDPLAPITRPGTGGIQPPSIEQQNLQGTYPNGGSFPNVSPIAANALPAGVGAPPAASGLPGGSNTGQLSDAAWQKDFTDKFGFFDPRFNSRENMLANAQQGDTAIADQMRYMAGLDSDAARVQGGINAHPDFYRSQMAGDWGGRHNQQIQDRIAAGEFAQNAGGGGGGNFNNRLGAAPGGGGGGGQIQNLAALQNLQSQQYRTPAGGIVPDSQAFADGTKIVGELAQLKGVTLAPDPLDSYGNIVFSENGQVRHIPMNEWKDWAGAISNRLAAQNAPPAAAAGGGGGYAPRGYAPRGGGGGGGNAPAVAGPDGVAQSPQELYGNRPINMRGYGPPDANSPLYAGTFVGNMAGAVGNAVGAMAGANAAYTNANYGPGDSTGYTPISGSNTAAAAARYPYEFPGLIPEQDPGLGGAYGNPAYPGIPADATTLPPRMRRG